MVGFEVFANTWINTRQPLTGFLNSRRFTVELIHIGGRPAEVRNSACETGHHVANFLDFAEDRFFRSALNNAAFVFGNRTERAATETATHDIDRRFNHVIGGNSCVAIRRVRAALVVEAKYPVHFFCFERNGRRVNPYLERIVTLHKSLGIIGIRFLMQHARGMRVERRIVNHFAKRGQANVGCLSVVFFFALQRHRNYFYRLGCVRRIDRFFFGLRSSVGVWLAVVKVIRVWDAFDF